MYLQIHFNALVGTFKAQSKLFLVQKDSTYSRSKVHRREQYKDVS
jgi:hypothetical protein